MLKLNSKYDCCGCTACASICKYNAITMETDEEGFLYPLINSERCTDCGICEKVCPIIHYDTLKDTPQTPLVIALHNNNEEIWESSSSGGAFAEFVSHTIQSNGIVFGAVFDKNFKVIHKKATNISEALKFRGSKYVQSDLTNIFQEIKHELNQGKEVLFSGTPCQVNGLKRYLRKDYANLFTIDILCHGVPSPKIFQEYINFIKQNTDFKLTDIFMKDKTFGWGYQKVRLYFGKNASQFNTVLSNLWNKIYYSHLATRPACHSCRFTNYRRPGDITIGDFWGIEKFHPNFTSTKGISLVLINSPQGITKWNIVKNNFTYIESNIHECQQPNLLHPVIEPKNKEKFWNDYHNMPFAELMKKYYNVTSKQLFNNRIKALLQTIKKHLI